MTGLDKIREHLCQSLVEAGIPAVTAWSKENKKRMDGPVAAVSLRGCEGWNGGFQDYLGERYNADSQRWEELYGKRAKFTFGLDLYSAAKDGAAQCQKVFDRIADLFQEGTPAGLKLINLSREETVYDEGLGLFRCGVEAVCSAYLYAVAEENGTFVDFEVRGERKG